MNADIMNKALRATARVACYAGWVGFAGCDTKTADTAQDTGTTGTADTGGEPVPADTGEASIVIPEEPTFGACMEAIDAGFAEPGFDTSQLLECCLLATEEVGYDALYNDAQYAELQENCCAEIANQNEFSAACTPWGPPTPPAMTAN